MFANTKATNGFAVDDIDAAKQFYGETLGLGIKVLSEEFGLISTELAGGRNTLVYRKPDFVPATYTILNFEVDDVDAAVDELAAKGVSLERYEGFEQDEKGIARGPGPQIAWFKDPAGQHPLGPAAALAGRRFRRSSSFAFWAANSSSVRIPWAFSSPSSLSWSIIDWPPAAGAAGSGGGRRRLLSFFLLCPTLALAARDAVADGGRGAGDDRRACHSSK